MKPGLGRAAAVLAVLMLLATPTTALGTAQSPSSSDWAGVDGNYPFNWNYSPQGVITKANAASLQVAWTYPVPDAPTTESSAVGVMVTPLVVQGVLYAVTNWGAIIALDMANGKQVWSSVLPLEQNYSQYLQPSIPTSLGIPIGHYHQMIYTTRTMGQPLIWVVANTYQVFAVNAYTGDIVLNFNPFIQGKDSIVSNFGLYDQDTPTILIDDKRGVLIFGPSDSEGESAGRGLLEGWAVNSTSPTLLWTTFLIPPQDGTDPTWSLDSVGNMSHAYVFNGTGAVDLKSLPRAELRQMLLGDWGNFGFDGYHSYAGASAGWGGSWALDETSGTAYVGTSSATPAWNATDRPGLDLWSDSVLAVNDQTGAINWAFQGMPHALGDLDCSWNVVLANQTVGGRSVPTVFKGCKDGYLFSLDAGTGALRWYLKPSSVGYIGVRMLNPQNRTEMTKVNWYGYPSTAPQVQNPSDTGSLESDISFDPTSNLLVFVTYNQPKLFQLTDVGPSSAPFTYSDWEFNWGTKVLAISQSGPVNSTVTAVNAATGAEVWNHLVKYLPFRGGVTLSGGAVFVPLLNGTLLALSELTGATVASKNIGGELLAQPAIAQDASGNTLLVLNDMGSTRWGPAFAGFVQALRVGEPPAGTSPSPAIYLLAAAGGGVAALLAAVLYYERRVLKLRQSYVAV